MIKTGQLRAHIRQLCCLGLPSGQLMPQLLRAVRRLVSADSAAFFWVNAAGEMTNLYAERVLPSDAMQIYFERYHDGSRFAFKQAFAHRARQPEPVSAVTASPADERSEYYNEIMKPLDAYHVLYGVVREQGQALGQLSLYRSKQSPPFSGSERVELVGVTHYVAHALAYTGRQEAKDEDFRDTEDDALVVIDAAGTVRHATPAARKLLLMASADEINRGNVVDAEERMQASLAELALRLRRSLAGDASQPPRFVVTNNWGRFALRAYTLSDDPLRTDAPIGVHIQRQEPLLLRLVEGLERLPLSPQQREIAVMLAKGHSNQEMAERLNVSANTIAYHIKQTFLKLDAHDRHSALARVLAEAGEAGAP